MRTVVVLLFAVAAGVLVVQPTAVQSRATDAELVRELKDKIEEIAEVGTDYSNRSYSMFFVRLPQAA